MKNHRRAAPQEGEPNPHADFQAKLQLILQWRAFTFIEVLITNLFFDPPPELADGPNLGFW